MKKLLLLLTITFLMISVVDIHAQRRSVTYESLLQRTGQPSAYIDDAVIPVDDSKAVFSTFFRLDYDFIPFLRKRPNTTPPSEELEYFAPVRMGIEIYEGEASDSRRANRNRTSVFRDSFSDTVWVESFEQTRSRLNHTTGFIRTELNAGDYHYELQVTRGESIRENSSRNRNITVPEYSSWEKGSFILLKQGDRSDGTLNATLLNYGSNVLYGQDYDLLVVLPRETSTQYSFSIYKMRIGSDDETQGDAIYEAPLTQDDLFTAANPVFDRNGNEVTLQMDTETGNIQFAHLSIPNQDFENTRYKLMLQTDGEEAPIFERIVSSQWLDMPISLYNIDVAIRMMKFIVNESELRRLNSGSTSEKEEKFRDFWAERDPTPDTEFNELMSEYYKRVDHAYENFTALQVPGFETDRGQAYILYGPPDNIERQFPTGQPTREIWEYPNRTLVFESAPGFRDFQLVSEN